ncbi:MAG: hypothetical protein EBS06_01200 [Proteobacteria bacterium]|nr:hypothetical protein [Pseudomonadota bacterium]
MTKNYSSSDRPKLLEESIFKYLENSKNELLQEAAQHFFSKTFLTIKIGIELEFYLLQADQNKIEDKKIVENFIFDLSKKIPQNSLIYKIEPEQGSGQIEVKTLFNSDLLKICAEINSIKIVAKNLALEKNLDVSFAAQKFSDDCGSALQFNISLHDSSDKSLFNDNQEILQQLAASLLKITNAMMIFLAPAKEDYQRFSYDLNLNLFKKGKFTAPVNLSFGADNRTCAIRVAAPPKNQNNKFGKRLEYRVAAANCSVELCLSAILITILYAIENDTKPLNQIHGNAFDEQYKTEKICQNLDEAKDNFFAKENFIREFLLKKFDIHNFINAA